MFYTYLWLRDNGTPYYVGKGKEDRAFHRSGHTVRPPLDRTRILIQEFLSEEDAFEAEKFLISYYGRANLGLGCLRNLTDGGDGPSGYKRSPESVERTAAFNRGKKHTLEHRAKLSAARRTWQRSKESVEKTAEGHRGKKRTPQTCANIRAAVLAAKAMKHGNGVHFCTRTGHWRASYYPAPNKRVWIGCDFLTREEAIAAREKVMSHV